jgi:hypothetical protein
MWRVVLTALVLAAAGCGERRVAASGGDAGSAISVMATCAEVKGTAQLRRSSHPYWEPLTEGGILRDGDWVRTLAESHARIEFMTGGSLELSENAVVVVEMPAVKDVPAGVAAAPRVSVESGEVQATPAYDDRARDAKPLLVRTPDGKTSVLQAEGDSATPTTFRLSASDAGVSVAAVRGQGTVKSAETVLPVSTKAAAVLAAETPPKPVELPDFPASLAPGIDARLKFEQGKTKTRLLWSPVDDAVGYRIQIARDLSFTVQVRNVDVPSLGYSLEPDSKGLYVWRVATRTKGGVVGEYGFARRIFYEVDEPKEMLLGPEDATTVSFAGDLPVVPFTWQAGAQNTTYRLMISRAGDPQIEPVVSVTTTDQRFEVKTLGAGEYHWGVYVDGRVLKPLFLKPRKLVVKAVPRAVVKTPKSINKWE